MDTNYEKKAYISLYNIVDNFYWEKENDSITALSGDMCPYLFKDSNSADLATYESFARYLDYYYTQSNKMDVLTAYKAAIRFLKLYRDEFGFEIDEYIKRLTLDMYKQEFNSLA